MKGLTQSLYLFGICISIVLLSVVAFSAHIAFAQDGDELTKGGEELPSLIGTTREDFESTATGEDLGAIKVADVNVYDVRIEKQEDRDIYVLFEIMNNDNVVQPQVRYAVQLLEYTEGENGTSYSILDEHVYNEVLSLDAGELVKRSVKYTTPPGFGGSYAIGVFSMNESGMPFSITHASKYVDVPESNSSVQIEGKCYFLVAEEEYILNYGVDVDSSELLELVCAVSNYTDEEQSVTPHFIIRDDSNFGPIVSEWTEENPIVLDTDASNELKRLQVRLPEVPRSYYMEFFLLDSGGEVITKSIFGRFVVRGVSARVDNVKFDKDHYQAGETAKLSLLFSGRADYFFGSRMYGTEAPSDIEAQFIPFTVSVKNGFGDLCADPVDGTYRIDDSNPTVSIDIPIHTKCIDPQAEVNAKDEEGNVLDSNTFAVETKDDNNENSVLLVGIIFLILALIGIGIARFKGEQGDENQSTASMALFVSIIVGVSFFPFGAVGVNTTQAATFEIPPPGPWRSLGWSVRMTGNTNKSTYTTSDSSNVRISGTMKQKSCSNHPYTAARGYVNGSSVASTACRYRQGYCDSDSYSKNVSRGGPGNHSATISAVYMHRGWGDSGSAKVRWSVIDPTPSVNLNASPNPVDYDTSSTLSWSVSNASSCTASGGWSGSKSTSGGTKSTGNLTSDTSYTLTCTNNSKSASDSITVQVNDPPEPSVSLSASPNPTYNGGSSTLTWDVSNADQCNASGDWNGSKSTSGGYESTGILTSNKTYNILCTNDHGSDSDSVTISVVTTECSDGIDNDGDNWIDYPDDLGCSDGLDDNEANAGPTQCSDKTDNDGDGDIDGHDQGCLNANDNDEDGSDYSLNKTNNVNVTLIGGSEKTSNQTTIGVDAVDSFDDPVTLSVSDISPDIPDAEYTFDDRTLDADEYANGTPFQVTVPGDTLTGDYTITIHGDSGDLTRTIDVLLQVESKDPQFQNI